MGKQRRLLTSNEYRLVVHAWLLALREQKTTHTTTTVCYRFLPTILSFLHPLLQQRAPPSILSMLNYRPSMSRLF